MKLHPLKTIAIGFGALALLASTASSTFGAEGDGLDQLLRQRLENMRATDAAQINGASIAAVDFIPELYENRQFRPAWTDQTNVDAALKAIYTSSEQGLNPSDFHAEHLDEALANPKPDLDARADFELLMSDAFVRFAYQMLFGKVDPVALDADWNFGGPIFEEDPATVINRHLDAGTLAELIPRAEPEDPFYQQMKAALKRYREIEAAGGWSTIAEGGKLEAGMQDDRVPALRRRLQVTGDLAENADANSNAFDDQLDEAVKRVQARHGLEADGIVGPGTLGALNVPVEDRINQIRVNLERARWVLHGLAPEYVIVNIAGFRVYLVKDGRDVWTTRAVVGKPYRKTPVFKADMTYVEFNPTWTVPPTILRNDILPKVRENPSYLSEMNFSVVDSNGNRVEPASVDWSAGKIPYQIVQEPGPGNALGEIKFMFPNDHFVYLHDTPSKELFERTERTFSSGCIRVDKPFEFAEVLLGADQGMTAEKIEAIRASGKTETVNLETPLPVLLLYWTAEPDADGTVRFLNDVYERDAQILEALDETFATRI